MHRIFLGLLAFCSLILVTGCVSTDPGTITKMHPSQGDAIKLNEQSELQDIGVVNLLPSNMIAQNLEGSIWKGSENKSNIASLERFQKVVIQSISDALKHYGIQSTSVSGNAFKTDNGQNADYYFTLYADGVPSVDFSVTELLGMILSAGVYQGMVAGDGPIVYPMFLGNVELPMDSEAAYSVHTHSLYGTHINFRYNIAITATDGEIIAKRRFFKTIKTLSDFTREDGTLRPEDEAIIVDTLIQVFPEMIAQDLIEMGFKS